jgi:hypothetical protein
VDAIEPSGAGDRHGFQIGCDTLKLPDESLEGWAPEPGADLPLPRIIDLAFDYRGNTTVVKTDGTRLDGYLFNRNADAPEPFVEMFDATGAGPNRVLYRDIRTIHFTGRDPAAGQSYDAWVSRRDPERTRPGSTVPPGA